MHVELLQQNSDEPLRQSAEALPYLAWICRADGLVTYVNTVARRYLPVPDTSQPLALDVHVPSSDASGLQAWWRNALEHPRHTIATFPLLKKNGVAERHLLCAEPLRAEDGVLESWLITATNIEMLGQIQELGKEEAPPQEDVEVYRSTLDNLPEAVVRLDRNWRFTYVNHGAAFMLGVPAEQLVGKILWEVFPDLGQSSAGRSLRHAVEQNVPIVFQQRIPASKKIIDVRANPGMHGLTVDFRDVTNNVLTANQLRMLEACIARLNEAVVISEFSSLSGTMGAMIYVNQAFENLLGFKREEVLSRKHLFSYAAVEQEQALGRIRNAIRNHEPVNSELTMICANDEQITVEMDIVPQVDESQKHFTVALIRDITERKMAAVALASSNRALQMYSACNETLVRAQTENELLDHICRSIIDIGCYASAWIAFNFHDDLKTLRCAAYAIAGKNETPPLDYTRSWDINAMNAHEPIARCLFGAHPVFVDRIVDYPGSPEWKIAALRRGEASMACLPLMNNGATFGVLALCSADQRSIDDQELKLLRSLADDISFGIANLRAQEDRRRMQAAVISIATGISASPSGNFFQTLTLNLQETLGTRAAVICTLPSAEVMETGATTMAAVIDGEVATDFSFDLLRSPCAPFLGETQQITASGGGVAEYADPSGLFSAYSPLAPLWQSLFSACRIDGPDGTPLGVLFVLHHEDGGNPTLITSTLQIFASSAAAEMERRKADAHIRRQASLLDQARDAIILCDFAGNVRFWNKGAERNYGWRADEMLGRSMPAVLGDDGNQISNAFAAIRAKGEWIGEIIRNHKDGSRVISECRWTLATSDGGDVDSILAIETDITRRKAAESEIEHLAFFDQLTGLPNRMMLMERLEHTISNLHGHGGALLFVDLDNFKDINDSFGHDIGDKMLIETGRRLAALVRKSDIVARSGSDEFVVILDHLSDDVHAAAEQAASVADKLLQALAQPFYFDSKEYVATCSIGIALFDDPDANVSEFVKRADLAMSQAKNAGRNNVCFFDPEIHAAVTARAMLEADFRASLKEQNFVLFYQPQLHQTGRLVGAEALIRWPHPKRGLVPPNEFIPLAEETNLIHPLGYWVLETAWRQLERWSKIPGAEDLVLAVNVSSRQFRHPDFVSRVIALISDQRADPRKLKLELTESLLLDDIDATVNKMQLLKEYGISFSLDDFGTGYSSLSYLKRLPLDQLKIDQSFIKDIQHDDSNDAAIAGTIIALGQSLSLNVIAEGVETHFQREFLAQNGCQVYQGYLFSRPLPVDKFEEFMQQNIAQRRISA